MRPFLLVLTLLPAALLAPACAALRSSGSNAIPADIRMAQEQDVLPQSCSSLGTIPVERRETLRNRIFSARANLVRYPVRDGALQIFRCAPGEIEKFEVWYGG